MAVRTAAQKAALRKAQLASAKKRRGKGKKRRTRPAGRARRAGREVKRRYQAGHKGKGAIYRRTRDRFKSQGYYSTRTGNKKSKRAGKIQRGYRKASTVASVANYGNATTLAVSYARHRQAEAKKKKKGTRKRKK